MKRLLKLGLGITFTFIMMLSLTGCGKEENKAANDNKPSQGQKQNNEAGNDWGDINETNYIAIIKDKTGINLNNLKGFTWKSGYGYSTKVAEVTGNYKEGTTKVAMFESFIKELLRVSNNSLWTTDVNNDTYRIEKVKEYKDYESFLEWKKNGNEDLESMISGGLYIDNYSINYTFTNTQFNVHIAYYVIK